MKKYLALHLMLVTIFLSACSVTGQSVETKTTTAEEAAQDVVMAVDAAIDDLTDDKPYSVLIVVAHPDDDAMFAGAVYKLTHDLGATVDVAMITDGAGGYRYSTLAEPIYGIKLTDEATARQYLPAIRKKELMAGGDIVGVRNYTFFDQPDLKYTRSIDTVLAEQWNKEDVTNRLEELMRKGNYDAVFGHLTMDTMHGAHKSATYLALKAAARLGADAPAILGGWPTNLTSDEPIGYDVLEGFPETKWDASNAVLQFNRKQTFGHNDRLNYTIVVNWLIAEHKSQGTMQHLMNRGEVENYFPLGSPPAQKMARVRSMFKELGE